MNLNNNSKCRWALTLAVASIVPSSGFSQAADPHMSMKGAEHLQYLNQPAKVEKLKTGDTIAMVCIKCKSVSVTRVERQRGREFLVPGTKHGCSGCGSVMEVVRMGDHGTDKQKLDTVKHVCKSCGDDSAFCCVTHRSASKTEGMEKK